MSCFKIREIILDTETTGLSVKTDRLIELAAIKLEDGRRTPHTYHSYFNPQPVKVSRSAFNVHGISNEFLSDKPAFKNCAREFLEFVAGHELIAHNARFDLQIINRELQMAGADPIDAGC